MGSFLPTLPFKLRGLDSYPGGTLAHWFMPAFAGRTHFVTNLPSTSDLEIWHKPRMDRCGSPDYMEDSAHSRRNPVASVFAQQDQGIDG